MCFLFVCFLCVFWGVVVCFVVVGGGGGVFVCMILIGFWMGFFLDFFYGGRLDCICCWW